MSTTTKPRRRRPHPARRARKLAGAVSVASLFALTGCMAATKTSTGTSSASVAGGTTSTTATTTPAYSDDDGAATSRSSSVAAVASAASTQSNTSTHAS